MKKLISIVLFLSLAVLCAPAFAMPLDNYGPWQYICKNANGTGTGVILTIEATANQNILIDSIIAVSDLASAVVSVDAVARGTSAFSTLATQEVPVLSIKTSATAYTPLILGGNHPENPLYVVDQGKAVYIRLSGTSYESIIVDARRSSGTMPLAVPSTAKGY